PWYGCRAGRHCHWDHHHPVITSPQNSLPAHAWSVIPDLETHTAVTPQLQSVSNILRVQQHDRGYADAPAYCDWRYLSIARDDWREPTCCALKPHSLCSEAAHTNTSLASAYVFDATSTRELHSRSQNQPAMPPSRAEHP